MPRSFIKIIFKYTVRLHDIVVTDDNKFELNLTIWQPARHPSVLLLTLQSPPGRVGSFH